MSETSVKKPSGGPSNTLIVAVTVVILAVILLLFRDREQKRQIDLRHLDRQVELWQDWETPQQRQQPTQRRTVQPNNTPANGGRIL